MIVFGLNSGAYVSEIMRGGINSVDIGQLEAGRTLGLSYTTTKSERHGSSLMLMTLMKCSIFS